MLDFSQEIKLDQKNYSLYRKLQLVLYLVAFLTALYLCYLIIFPHKNFYFSFLDPKASENNLDIPLSADKKTLSKGILSEKENIYFDTTMLDKYSKIVVSLDLDNKSKDSPEIFVRKSHKAFLYDTGEPLGFKNGTLLKNDNDYFIVSNGNLRKFSTVEKVDFFGFSRDAFLDVSKEELQYNLVGENITDSYPDGSLFLIDENYFILEKKELKKFVSDQAFLLSYKESNAIKKDIGFLDSYPISENLVGFPDGTLVSDDISVYILSGNKMYPINNPETFLSKGYQWEDVVSAGADELSIYEKQKLFNIKTPHPDGTVFKTLENSKYFLIKDGQKHPLYSENIASSWIVKFPIPVSEKSLETEIICESKKSFFNFKEYECEIPLEALSQFAGFNYQFRIESKGKTIINSINANFIRNVDIKNLKEFAIKIINEIKVNYAIK